MSIDWARDESAHEIALWVATNNDRARALYERCGFTATGESDTTRSGIDEIRPSGAVGKAGEVVLSRGALR